MEIILTSKKFIFHDTNKRKAFYLHLYLSRSKPITNNVIIHYSKIIPITHFTKMRQKLEKNIYVYIQYIFKYIFFYSFILLLLF